MKITFFSNFLNHHQLPFCKEMYSRFGEDFKFIATEVIPKERLSLGYIDMSNKYPFSINSYESSESYDKAIKLSIESDVVIIGSAKEKFIFERLKMNKLTFRYCERIFKRGIWRRFSPRFIKNMYNKHTIYRDKSVYMLCASSYTAGDFSILGEYKNKMYKWGYFPEFKHYEIDELISKKSQDKVSILWVGRLINWKHPEKALLISKQLKDLGYNFELNIIGTGELLEELKKLVVEFDLNDYVNLLGSIGSEQVRGYMEKSNIFIFTSDYNEGWGAVLNEAMNSGCAVIASHAIGSVQFLIKNKDNGIVYKDNNFKNLISNVIDLVEDKQLTRTMGKNAYLTIEEKWNSKIASENFINLCNSLLNDEELKLENGPCSIANPIKQSNMYKSIIKDGCKYGKK